jgi:hypothetical protein
MRITQAFELVIPSGGGLLLAAGAEGSAVLLCKAML